MPIKIRRDLPAYSKLESENIFVMDEKRALSQDVRPLQIVIVNLMPLKEMTELDLLRSLSNTPLQINVSFLQMETHVSKQVVGLELQTEMNHLMNRSILMSTGSWFTRMEWIFPLVEINRMANLLIKIYRMPGIVQQML